MKVVAVFLYETAEAEVDPQRQQNEEVRRLALSKYAKVLLRAKSVLSTKSSLELRMVDGNDDDKQRLRRENFGIFKLNGDLIWFDLHVFIITRWNSPDQLHGSHTTQYRRGYC